MKIKVNHPFFGIKEIVVPGENSYFCPNCGKEVDTQYHKESDCFLEIDLNKEGQPIEDQLVVDCKKCSTFGKIPELKPRDEIEKNKFEVERTIEGINETNPFNNSD